MSEYDDDLLAQQDYSQSSNAMDICHDPSKIDKSAAMEEAANACLHPMYEMINPRPGMVLTTRPHRRIANAQQYTASGLVALPDMQRARMNREFGFVATVLKLGRDVPSDFVKVGELVVAAQFAGTPLIDHWTCNHSDLWLIGENDVLAVLTNG